MLRVLVLVSLLVAPSTAVMRDAQARSGKEAFEKIFGKNCGNPCIAPKSYGGNAGLYMDAAQFVTESGIRVVIGSSCFSACAIFADFARANVCIRKGAVFGFHMGRFRKKPGGAGDTFFVKNGRVYNPPPHNEDIDQWVKARGNYPLRRLLLMPFDAARKFWSVCTSAPAASPRVFVKKTI